MIYYDEYRHRFIQPKVTYFQSTYIPSSSSLDLWKPIETPKKTVHFIHQPDNMVIEKSSIKLEEIEEPEKETIQPEDDNYLPTPKESGVDLTKNI